MANIYVGFHDQRSCNRILKPPGGGTSNIFGTDPIPDVVPQLSSPRNENRDKQNATIQQILQTESVSTVSRNGTTRTEQKVSSVESSVETIKNEESHAPDDTQNSKVIQENEPRAPDVVAEVTCKVEQVKIEEKSSQNIVTETDSSGNNKVLSNNGTSETVVEKQASFKRGSTIEDILKQDDVEEKKRVKGQNNQRVPPGGYSSGLW